jgi:hypothetical protein
MPGPSAASPRPEGCGSQDPAPATRRGFCFIPRTVSNSSSIAHTADIKCVISHVRHVTVGLDVPIRAILENDHAFGPEDIANLSAAFEAALTRLGLVDRGDPLTTVVAKAIIELAKEGERDPKKLCDGAVSILGK